MASSGDTWSYREQSGRPPSVHALSGSSRPHQAERGQEQNQDPGPLCFPVSLISSCTAHTAQRGPGDSSAVPQTLKVSVVGAGSHCGVAPLLLPCVCSRSGGAFPSVLRGLGVVAPAGYGASASRAPARHTLQPLQPGSSSLLEGVTTGALP